MPIAYSRESVINLHFCPLKNVDTDFVCVSTFDKNVDTFYVCVSTFEIHIGLKHRALIYK